jgi:hypothetical protein
MTPERLLQAFDVEVEVSADARNGQKQFFVVSRSR